MNRVPVRLEGMEAMDSGVDREKVGWMVPVVACANGHLHPTSDFAIAQAQVLCPRGHWNWRGTNYCGACGAPMSPRE